MPRLGQTTAALARYRRQWQTLAKMAAKTNAEAERTRKIDTPLRPVTGFGSNPGALAMYEYRPARLAASPALVLVLHGCTQNAAGYDHGSGWSTLADRYGFVLVYAEQTRANNPNLCFNWFQPGDIERGQGEALSIRQMVARAVADHGIDPGRVFVTGLSAGGAMTGVMLATYPEVFAGGAIIAGLPYGSAANVKEAFAGMHGSPPRPARRWGDLVRAASPHRGPWPKVSIWHGDADATVVLGNAVEIAKQWTDVHGLPERPTATGAVDGFPRSVWRGPDGAELIESYTIPGMAHGTPLATGDGEDRAGVAGPFLLEVGISSSYHIAKFWGLTGEAMPASAGEKRPEPEPIRVPNGAGPARGPASRPRPADEPIDADYEVVGGAKRPSGGATAPGLDVSAIIAKALRSAGLMKD